MCFLAKWQPSAWIWQKVWLYTPEHCYVCDFYVRVSQLPSIIIHFCVWLFCYGISILHIFITITPKQLHLLSQHASTNSKDYA